MLGISSVFPMPVESSSLLKENSPQTSLLFPSVSRPKPFYTLFNFTLLSQRKICLILMTDAEGEEVGVETMVSYKWVRSEKL